jgi:hypothetical protein
MIVINVLRICASSWCLAKAWLLCCPETSPTKCQPTPHDMPEKQRPERHRAEACDIAYCATFKSNCLPADEDDSYTMALLASGANVIPWNRPWPLSTTSHLLWLSNPPARTIRHIITSVVDKTPFSFMDCIGLCESTITRKRFSSTKWAGISQ